jgi:hypothetical protein
MVGFSLGLTPLECSNPADVTTGGACLSGETGATVRTRNERIALRWWSAIAALLLLTGCREVRVKTYAQGTTTVPGGTQIEVVRSTEQLERLGIKAPVRFRGEFGIVLLMGPHHRTGYRQIIESIRANDQRVRVVAFEQAPPDGGEESRDYRTYTLWIIPNGVYEPGIRVEVVTPSEESVANTVLP